MELKWSKGKKCMPCETKWMGQRYVAHVQHCSPLHVLWACANCTGKPLRWKYTSFNLIIQLIHQSWIMGSLSHEPAGEHWNKKKTVKKCLFVITSIILKIYINKKQCVYELLEYTKYKRVMRVLLNHILQH